MAVTRNSRNGRKTPFRPSASVNTRRTPASAESAPRSPARKPQVAKLLTAPFANEKLHFKVHDMREMCNEKYDAIFNLFTSFCYFEDDADNYKTIKAIHNSLTETGFAVIDFMNVDYVLENLVANEIKSVDGIDFHIKRYLKDGHIYKEIDFEDKGEKFHFTEKVQALRLEDFEKIMEEAGIYLLDIFGDYKLRKFFKTQSERLIMIFK